MTEIMERAPADRVVGGLSLGGTYALAAVQARAKPNPRPRLRRDRRAHVCAGTDCAARLLRDCAVETGALLAPTGDGAATRLASAVEGADRDRYVPAHHSSTTCKVLWWYRMHRTAFMLYLLEHLEYSTLVPC
jgi:hypothetical protein